MIKHLLKLAEAGLLRIAGAAFELFSVNLPAQSAGGATATTILGVVPSTHDLAGVSVTRMSLTSPSLVTGQATNFATISFRQLRAGSVVATLGSYALNASSVTLPAEAEQVVPLSGAPVLQPGDVLEVQQVQTGTGLALPAGINAKIEFE